MYFSSGKFYCICCRPTKKNHREHPYRIFVPCDHKRLMNRNFLFQLICFTNISVGQQQAVAEDAFFHSDSVFHEDIAVSSSYDINDVHVLEGL